MKLPLTLFLSIFLFSFSSDKNIKGEIKTNEHHYKFSEQKDMLNGAFKSYWPNGELKTKGKYLYNQKVGAWKTWNKKGNLSSSRIYANNFSFTSNSENLKYSRSNNGIIQYEKLENVVWSKRIWQKINSENDFLYVENNFIQVLKDIFGSKKIRLYSPNSDELKIILSAEEKRKLISSDNSELSLRIKEDWFFDLKSKTMQTRIIALGIEKEGVLITWLYYPDLRNNLNVKISTSIKNQPYITNLEDIFHFRHFSSTVIKESNVYDKSLDEIHDNEANKLMNAKMIRLNIVDSEALILNQLFEKDNK